MSGYVLAIGEEIPTGLFDEKEKPILKWVPTKWYAIRPTPPFNLLMVDHRDQAHEFPAIVNAENVRGGDERLKAARILPA